MTYTELKALVQQYLENEETSFVANIDDFTRLAEEEIYRQVQLHDLKTLATTTTNTGDRYLATPSDFLAAYSMAVKDGDEYTVLLSKDVSFMREAFPDTTATGKPRFYSLLDDKNFILGPTPDDEYEIEMNYFFEQESLVDIGDGKETWLSKNAKNAILFGVLYHGYIYMKGDQDVIKMYQDKYIQALADLKIIAEGRNRKDSYRTSDKRLPV